jgi:hypothetical protein
MLLMQQSAESLVYSIKLGSSLLVIHLHTLLERSAPDVKIHTRKIVHRLNLMCDTLSSPNLHKEVGLLHELVGLHKALPLVVRQVRECMLSPPDHLVPFPPRVDGQSNTFPGLPAIFDCPVEMNLVVLLEPGIERKILLDGIEVGEHSE